MQPLSPFGMLVLYLAVASATPSCEKVVIRFSEDNRMTLTQTTENWFVRETDLGSQIFQKKEGTKLLAREDSNSVQTVDLSIDFDLTGKEDWSKPQRIRVHRKQESPEDHWIKTTPQKTGLIVEASQGNKRERVMIDWVLKKN